jgi:predicted RNA binding protein YcfA (HicA-like mRNA interferase family)
MNFSSKNLIRILEQNGYVFKRANGSHHLYFNASTGKTIIVPVHGKKDLPKGTFFAILRQSGLSKSEF